MPRVNRPPSRAVVPTRRPRHVKDRPGRWKLLWRRQRRLLPPAGWAFGGILAIAGIVVLVQSPASRNALSAMRERFGSITAGSGLRVQDVVVQGRSNTPEPLLRAAIGAAPGDPLLGYSIADAQARIETLSWVQHATVQRVLPATIVVTLTERRPFAVWQNQGKFVLIDRAGQVVADQDLAAFGKLPLVVGAGAPAAAASIIDLLIARPDLMSRVVAAVRVGDRRWNLRLNTGVDILLPEGQEDAALNRLMELQGSIALLDRPLQSVDLRLPDRLVVRPQPGAKKSS